MRLQIERKTGIPIYIQIKNQICELIERGDLKEGHRLPAEREMAKILKVSRNRVSTAYKALEQEGFVTSLQGKGTFVYKGRSLKESGKKMHLLKVIDFALEEALEMDYDLDDFLEIAYQRALEKKEQLQKIRVAFIECNQEQIDSFSSMMDLGPGVTIHPLLLRKIKEDPQEIHRLHEAIDLIITTSYHYQEIQEIMYGYTGDIIEITLDPMIETIIEIAKIPAEKKMGLMCISENFAKEVMRVLTQLNLQRDLYLVLKEKNESFNKIRGRVDFLITSPHCRKEVERLARPALKIIDFNFVPDQGSVKLVKMALLNLKEE